MRTTLKQLTLWVLLLLSISVYAVSCTSRPNYQNAIPADADIAAKIYLDALFNKAGLSENRDFKSLKKDFRAEYSDEIDSKDLQDILDKIMDNAYELGIDFAQPVIATIALYNNPTFTVIAALRGY